MMSVMSVKCKFTIDEVINLTENCYYVTADDVDDLCDLREIGFKNVRCVGGCIKLSKSKVKVRKIKVRSKNN